MLGGFANHFKMDSLSTKYITHIPISANGSRMGRPLQYISVTNTVVNSTGTRTLSWNGSGLYSWTQIGHNDNAFA